MHGVRYSESFQENQEITRLQLAYMGMEAQWTFSEQTETSDLTMEFQATLQLRCKN